MTAMAAMTRPPTMSAGPKMRPATTKKRPRGARKGQAEGPGRCIPSGGWSAQPGQVPAARAAMALPVAAGLHAARTHGWHRGTSPGRRSTATLTPRTEERQVGERVEDAEDDGEGDEQEPDGGDERPQRGTGQVHVLRLAPGRQRPRHAGPVRGRVALPVPGQAGDAHEDEQRQEQGDVLDEVVPGRDDDLGDELQEEGPDLSEVHVSVRSALVSDGWPPS